MPPNSLYLEANRDDLLYSFCEGASPRASYDTLAIRAFDALGRRILQDPRARQFPDLVTFGFKCSRNLQQQQEEPSSVFRSGVGTVLHIAPANIPMNFAYSLLMAALAGNASIVRLPSREFPQVSLFLEIIDSLYGSEAADFFFENVRFFRSSREDPILRELIASLDGLVVWGGDAAVQYFRSLSKPPSSREVYFPDRKSSAIFNADAVLGLDGAGLVDLANDFFNDTYLVDQNACSSPSTIVWVGSEEASKNAPEKFWSAVHQVLEQKYKSNSTVSIEKLNGLVDLVESIDDSIAITARDALIWRFHDLRSRAGRLRFGQFFESSALSLQVAVSQLRGDEQTLTYFGFETQAFDSQLASGSLSVDRVCRVGKALDMGIVWDGKDVVAMLSRSIVIE